MQCILYFKKDKTLKFVKYEEILDKLYYLEAKVPTIKNIKEYIKKGDDPEIINYIDDKSPQILINEIKKEISQIDYKIPLYDEYTKNLYIIPREQVYKKVIYQSYRFPNKQLIDFLIKKKLELEPLIEKLNKKTDLEKNLGEFEVTSDIHYKILQKKVILKREYRKLDLMLDFLKSFDINTLQTTYIKAFYYYSDEVGKNITICIRPSFLPHFKHINPYYTRSELINLALNMELIKPSNKFYNQENVMELCDLVKENDITADTILKHQEHIIKNNKIGIIQYYSLQGSYFMNKYLRNISNDDYKNELLENIIISMWKLINSAPAFDKSYTLYRFIKNDNYLRHLKIGDTFIDPSFISTTRDPFYRSETYKFGFILIKIKIPKDIEGIGLCIESFSHFPEEEEIVLHPLSILRLDKKDNNALYYHTDNYYASNITTRYEFTYIGKEKLRLIEKQPVNKSSTIDFLKIKSIDSLTVYEKIKYFINEYVNKIFQFTVLIGNKEIDLIIEWYDSTNAYKNFYAATTNNGFSLYTIINNYISFFIEIGEDNDETYMYVNYYFKYASSSKESLLNDNDFIDFLSRLAYYFGITNIIIYSEYISCDLQRKIIKEKDIRLYHGGNYCLDFYNYLKFKEKRFQKKNNNIDTTVLKPLFSYYDLDRLKNTDPHKILNKDDRDEIYQIYVKIYKNIFGEEMNNLSDFYIWMVENNCIYVNTLVDKMNRLYTENNPFDNDFYKLDSSAYLYNKGMIAEIPFFKKSKENISKITEKSIPKNEYRLDLYRKTRTPIPEKT